MFSELIKLVLDKKTTYHTDLNIINNYIEKILFKTKIQNDICQIIMSSGKRIRSLFALDIYYQYYKIIPIHIYKILALVELIHFGSLLHDDVIDKNNVRRGKRSVYNLYGSKKTILLGDYLLIKIFNEITKSHFDQCIIDRFIKTASAIAYGACFEQNLNTTCCFKDYIKTVSLKTSSLFRFASTIGLRNLENISKIGIYATCFGIIYQVQNDLDDYNIEIFENSEDYIQNNVTYPFIKLSSKHLQLFINKNQDNFLQIKKFIQSEEFKRQAIFDLSKYLKRLTNSNVHIK